MFILDALKGAFSIYLAYIIHKITNTSISVEYLITIAALSVIIGHTYPIMFGFKGRKRCCYNDRSFISNKPYNTSEYYLYMV